MMIIPQSLMQKTNTLLNLYTKGALKNINLSLSLPNGLKEIEN